MEQLITKMDKKGRAEFYGKLRRSDREDIYPFPAKGEDRIYPVLNSSGRTGNLLILFPTAEKMAFPTAGAIGGTPGSPTPPGGS